MRRPIMAGNWKMNKTNDEAHELASGLKAGAGDVTDVEVLICPPATALSVVAAAVEGSNIEVGAQDMFWEEEGAFTGEISAPMIKSAGASWVILGHSERRGRFGSPDEDFTEELQEVFGDTDASVNIKLRKALDAGLNPIVCCGELLSEREAGNTDQVVADQVKAMFEGVDTADFVIAYEPVWAIGTGEVCDADEANRVCGLIRSTVADVADEQAAEAMRVLYGGSVKPKNVDGLMAREHIDGGLVGGASLEADSFVQLIEAAKR